MNLLIIGIICLSLTIIVTLVIMVFLFKNNKKKKILAITKDLNTCYSTLKPKPINSKELPVSVENITHDIYYSDKVILGKYENVKAIKGQTIILKVEHNKKKKFFLRYKWCDGKFIKSSAFIPLNQIDLLVSKNKVYFIDAFDLKTISIANIKKIGFFWEKNRHIKNKQKYIGVEIKTNNEQLFLLFNKDKQAIKFVAHIMVLA